MEPELEYRSLEVFRRNSSTLYTRRVSKCWNRSLTTIPPAWRAQMIGVAAILGIALCIQDPSQAIAHTEMRPGAPLRVKAPTDSGAVAVRATVPPTIDGRDDDPIWRETPV